MNLKEWLTKNNIRPSKAARDMGIGTVTLYRNLNNVRRCTVPLAEKIEKFTKGQVSRTEAIWPEIFINDKYETKKTPIPVFFDKEGNEIDAKKFVELFQNKEYQRIKQDKLDNFIVSTVWLGINHAYDGSFKIFETIVFDLEQNEIQCERYTSEKEALIGHDEVLTRVAKVNMLLQKQMA